jgi:cytochrome c-type biogenesis protein CcmF
LPRSVWGTAAAHFGIGLTLLGIVCVTHWSDEKIVELKPGESTIVRHYHLTFEGIVPRQGPNYRDQVAKFTVRSGGEVVGEMMPSKRTFVARDMTTTESALMTRGVSQLYISIGDARSDGSIAVRIYYKPLVLLIWLGAVVMAIGGGLSLSDRRLRVGAPKPAAKAAIQPAE